MHLRQQSTLVYVITLIALYIDIVTFNICR